MSRGGGGLCLGYDPERDTGSRTSPSLVARSAPESRQGHNGMQKSWDKLGDPSFQEGKLEFSLSEGTVTTRFQRARSPAAPLLVWLHGAVDRQRRSLPVFSGPVKDFAHAAHQLAVCDPTLQRHETLRNGWYVGDERLNVQAELCDFFARAAHVLDAKRVVYLGGSGGGFASLYFSSKHANSCAVVVQPQTNLKYFPYSRRYLKLCWPGKALSDLRGTVCTDLCRHYAKGFRNAVVYIQGIADDAHFRDHFGPFQYAIRECTDSAAIFHVDYWGEAGHAAVPQPVVHSWIRAAILASTLSMVDLLETHYRVRQGATTQRAQLRKGVGDDSGPAKPLPAADVLIADRLRDFQLARD